MRQLSTRDQNDTEINNYRSLHGLQQWAKPISKISMISKEGKTFQCVHSFFFLFLFGVNIGLFEWLTTFWLSDYRHQPYQRAKNIPRPLKWLQHSKQTLQPSPNLGQWCNSTTKNNQGKTINEKQIRVIAKNYPQPLSDRLSTLDKDNF